MPYSPNASFNYTPMSLSQIEGGGAAQADNRFGQVQDFVRWLAQQRIDAQALARADAQTQLDVANAFQRDQFNFQKQQQEIQNQAALRAENENNRRYAFQPKPYTEFDRQNDIANLAREGEDAQNLNVYSPSIASSNAYGAKLASLNERLAGLGVRGTDFGAYGTVRSAPKEASSVFTIPVGAGKY